MVNVYNHHNAIHKTNACSLNITLASNNNPSFSYFQLLSVTATESIDIHTTTTRKKRFPMNRLPLCLTFFASLFLCFSLFLSLLIVPCLKASQAASHLQLLTFWLHICIQFQETFATTFCCLSNQFHLTQKFIVHVSHLSSTFLVQ